MLGIETYSVDFNVLDTSPTVEKDVNRLLKWVAKNKENVSGTCGFNSTFYVDCEPGGIVELRERHAYAIKNIKYGKEIIITDPHDSEIEIKVPWEDFFEHTRRITFSFKDSETVQAFKKEALPANYEKMLEKYK